MSVKKSEAYWRTSNVFRYRYRTTHSLHNNKLASLHYAFSVLYKWSAGRNREYGLEGSQRDWCGHRQQQQ